MGRREGSKGYGYGGRARWEKMARWLVADPEGVEEEWTCFHALPLSISLTTCKRARRNVEI